MVSTKNTTFPLMTRYFLLYGLFVFSGSRRQIVGFIMGERYNADEFLFPFFVCVRLGGWLQRAGMAQLGFFHQTIPSYIK